tara:strand:- start:119 stop:442 length:324 start_codon:yes stop_codon:yes gene_type:complete
MERPKESARMKSEKRPRSEDAESAPPRQMQRVCVPMAGFATETSVELLTQYLNFTALLLKEGFTFERFETYGFVYVREVPDLCEQGQGWAKEYLGVRGGQQAVETCE